MKQAILFGAGENMKRKWKLFEKNGYKVIGIVDNSPQMQQEIFYGLQIRNPRNISKMEYDSIIITLLSPQRTMDIIHQLKTMDIQDDKIMYVSGDKIVRFGGKREEAGNNKRRPRIYFDVTNIIREDRGTGIQRAVKSIYANLKKANVNIVPVQYLDCYRTAWDFEYSLNGKIFNGEDVKLKFIKDDKIFFADTSWNDGIDNTTFEELGKQGVKFCFIAYDLIPILYEDCVKKTVTHNFRIWLNQMLKYADYIVCISHAVAEDLKCYYNRLNVKKRSPLPIYVVHLGYDFPTKETKRIVRQKIKDFCNDKTFLMVGTVEKRKNHLLALNAMEKIAGKQDIKLLIFGRDGWGSEAFKEKYNSMRTSNPSVLWINDASDEEVVWGYKHTYALLYPTKCEGFGLPLIEASHYGLPILCSNLPVFREIAGDGVIYFKVDNEEALVKSVLDFMKKNVHVNFDIPKMFSWESCSNKIKDILDGKIKSDYLLD